MVFDGLSPRLAEITGKHNPAVPKKELDAEVEEPPEREQQSLMRKLRRLMKDAEDEGRGSPPDDSAL
jgi:hypothetical protein